MVKYGKERIFTKEHKLIDTNNYSTEGLCASLSPKKIEYLSDKSIYLSMNDFEIIQKANLLIENALGYNIKLEKLTTMSLEDLVEAC